MNISDRLQEERHTRLELSLPCARVYLRLLVFFASLFIKTYRLKFVETTAALLSPCLKYQNSLTSNILSQHAATEVLTALRSGTDTSPRKLSALGGSVDKQLSQMSSVYLCGDAARHLSSQCEGPSIKSIQSCKGNRQFSASWCEEASKRLTLSRFTVQSPFRSASLTCCRLAALSHTKQTILVDRLCLVVTKQTNHAHSNSNMCL